jgi:chaperonin GroEL (HSP60 family)
MLNVEEGVLIAEEDALKAPAPLLWLDQVGLDDVPRVGGKNASPGEMWRAVEAPARQIAQKSGADPGVVVDRMRAGTGAFSFDAVAGRYIDLLDAGSIGPTRVVRVALENAVSVASVLLLTEATRTEVPEPEKAAPAGAGGGLET